MHRTPRLHWRWQVGGTALLSLMGLLLLVVLRRSDPHLRVTYLVGEIPQVVASDRAGTAIAVGTKSGTLTLWDRTTAGTALHQWSAHQSAITALRFHPTQPWLLSASADGTVAVWDRQGQLVRTLVGITPDGPRILHERPARQQREPPGIVSMAVSIDGTLVALGGVQGLIVLERVTTGQVIQLVRGHPNPDRGGTNWDVTALAFSADGQHLASGGWDGSVTVWDVTTGIALPHLDRRDSVGIVKALQFVEHDQQLFVVGSGSQYDVRALGAPQPHVRRSLPCYFLPSFAFAPDGVMYARGGDLPGAWPRSWVGFIIPERPDGQIYLERVGPGAPERVLTLTGHQGRVNSVAFSADGQTLVSGGADGTVRVWDVALP